MKTITEFIYGVVLVVALGVCGSVLAADVSVKETVSLTIGASTLSQSLRITDQWTLTLSNVFRGGFIGGPATEPDSSWPRYAITFNIQTLEGVKAPAYAVRYCKNPLTGEGFIYLPGRGDDAYRLNISTIMRDGLDGKWHRAAAEWSESINKFLP